MARTRDPKNEIYRRNLKKFREAAQMTQEQAALASGVNLDNLRRYERGGSGISFDTFKRLAPIYGHAIEDFAMEEPPPPRLGERDPFHMAALPGMEVDADLVRQVKEFTARINTTFRARKAKKAKS